MSAQPNSAHITAPEIDEESRARIDETLSLMVRFVEMLGDDASIADAIPANASVIFLPHDDADLAARNRAAGERMRAAGATVHFIEV